MQKNVVYNKGVIELISKPHASSTVKVYTRPEDRVYYKFDIKNTKYKVLGNSIELIFEDNSKFLFVSVLDMRDEQNPPLIVLKDGKEVSIETIMLKIADEEVYTTLLDTQSKFEEKLKSFQVDLANEFKKVEKMKADLEKEKNELFEFKTNKTITKEVGEKMSPQINNTIMVQPKQESKQPNIQKEPAQIIEAQVEEVKPVKKDDNLISLNSILSSEESSKIDEIDSIIRELDIR